jgi:hypothetical protein
MKFATLLSAWKSKVAATCCSTHDFFSTPSFTELYTVSETWWEMKNIKVRTIESTKCIIIKENKIKPSGRGEISKGRIRKKVIDAILNKISFVNSTFL